MRLFPVRHRIGTANMYVGNPAPLRGAHRLIAAVRPWRLLDSIGLQEVGDYLDELAHVDGYQLVAAPWGDRYHRANAVLVRDDLKVIERKFITAAAGTGTKYTPARTIALVGYIKRGVRVMHIDTHLHVVPEEDLAAVSADTWSRAARQYARQALMVRELANEYAENGWTVFVTADGNTRPHSGVPDWSMALYAVLAREGYEVTRNGVDLVASDPALVEKLDSRLVSRYVTGSDDHEAIVVRYKRRKR